jgi:hypothetical protein
MSLKAPFTLALFIALLSAKTPATIALASWALRKQLGSILWLVLWTYYDHQMTIEQFVLDTNAGKQYSQQS